MSKEQELLRKLPELVKETKTGRIFWDVECQTTEFNTPEDKPVVTEEDGTVWTVDECFVSYHCEYKGSEFLMITYEMIHSRDDSKKTTNLVFLPPLGIRVFDIHALLPYAVEADQMLTYQVHMLWLAVLELQKSNPDAIRFEADERQLTIEDDLA
jgi:hypothetical protein